MVVMFHGGNVSLVWWFFKRNHSKLQVFIYQSSGFQFSVFRFLVVKSFLVQ